MLIVWWAVGVETMSSEHTQELVELFDEFYSSYCEAEIRELAREYPARKVLYVDYEDVVSYNPDLVDDWVENPRQIQEHAEEALREYELPVDVALGKASVRLRNLSVGTSPIELSSDDAGTLVAIEGRVVEAGDVVTRVRQAAFECQRCGALTQIPQEPTGPLVEPHECIGCEREGPFEVLDEQSEFVESQSAVVEDVPNGLDGVAPESVDVQLEGDLAGKMRVGEVVVVTGVVELTQENGQVFEFRVEAVAVDDSESASESVVRWRSEYLGVRVESGTSGGVGAGALDKFVTRSREVIQQGGNLDEDNTQTKILTPLVHVLGWNVFDSSEVELEYPRQDSEVEGRVDYALFGDDGNPAIVMEAKQVGAYLPQHTGQIKRYMRLFGGEFGVLSNGERYMVYRRDDSEAPEETLVLDCELEELCDSEDVLASLSRDAFY